MKLQTLAERTAPLLPRLRCPQCGAPLSLFENRSLVCGHGHCFDLSAKGYVNLAPGHNQNAEKYNAELFQSRSRIFADGFYTPVAQALREAIDRHYGGAEGCVRDETAFPAAPSDGAPENSASQAQPPLMVDVGCGEGYYARELSGGLRPRTIVGVDLSRDAILSAARQSPALHWLVADLTRLPFANASVDVLIDVLTPADYHEFARVLAPEGVLIKVVPADDYLIEIRRAVADQLRGGDFSNARVVEHLHAHADVIEQVSVRRTLPVSPAQARDFLRMTPMTFGLSEPHLEGVRFTSITIAMELLICHLRQTEA